MIRPVKRDLSYCKRDAKDTFVTSVIWYGQEDYKLQLLSFSGLENFACHCPRQEVERAAAFRVPCLLERSKGEHPKKLRHRWFLYLMSQAKQIVRVWHQSSCKSIN